MGLVVEITENEYHQHTQDYDGLCLRCGSWTWGNTEPDAEGRKCDDCGYLKVVGTEQALLLGCIRFK